MNNRIAGSSAAVAFREYRRRWTPVISTMIASLASTAPLIVTTPVAPSMGFLVLLSWRLLRPELWMPYAALAFGLFDDFVAGHPLGQSMALWTLTFLALDFLDSRLSYRDFWVDWLCASGMLILHSFGAWYIARLMNSAIDPVLILPQIGLAILLYPLIARIVVSLDRWRLGRAGEA